MTKVEKATYDLRLTGWHSGKVAEKLGVSKRIARMYLNGQRRIPNKHWGKIPAIISGGDTHWKSRLLDEEKRGEWKACGLDPYQEGCTADDLAIFLSNRQKI